MTRSIIALITDFGMADSYVAQMKGIMLGINPEAHLVDVTHAIGPQQVERGAAVLDEVLESFPAGTIYLAVVDPGVGGSRAMLAAEIGRWRFVSPDNGLLSAVLRKYAQQRIIRIKERRYWRGTVSQTFHGRDILGPVAAHWSLGVDAGEFGPLHTESLVMLPERLAVQRDDTLVGEVVWCDGFGNLITSVVESQLPSLAWEALTVECAGRSIAEIRRHYAQVAPGEWIALVGSSGRLEIAVRDGSAAERLKLGEGATVIVRGLPTCRDLKQRSGA